MDRARLLQLIGEHEVKIFKRGALVTGGAVLDVGEKFIFVRPAMGESLHPIQIEDISKVIWTQKREMEINEPPAHSTDT